MAIYSVQLKSLSRGKGHSATAAAAYRAGIALDDPTTGERHDYTRRQGVVSVDMLAPEDAPAWASDPTELWGRVEQHETRANARLARELVLALPHELDPGARRALAMEVGALLVERYGAAVQVAVHAPDRGGDDRNHHAHILFTPRQVGPEGFGAYAAQEFDARGGQGAVALKELRAAIAGLTNDALAKAGLGVRVDHRTLAAQRVEAANRGDFKSAASLDRLPQEHEGKATTQARRRGELTPRARRNDRRARVNARRHDAHEASFQRAKAEAQADGRLAPYDEQAAHARALLERTREGRARLRQALAQATDSPTPRTPSHGPIQRRPRAPAITPDSLDFVRVSADRGHGLQPLPAVRPLNGASAVQPPGGGHPSRPGAHPAGHGRLLREDAPGSAGAGGPVQRIRGNAEGVARPPRPARVPAQATRISGNGTRESERHARLASAYLKGVDEAITKILALARKALQQPEALTPWQRATARSVLETWEEVHRQQRTNEETAAKERKARALRRRAEADANTTPRPRGRLAAARRALGMPSTQDQAAARAQEALAKAQARVARYKKRGQEGRLAFEALQREAEKARADFAQAFGIEVPRFDAKATPSPESPGQAMAPDTAMAPATPAQRAALPSPKPAAPRFRR